MLRERAARRSWRVAPNGVAARTMQNHVARCQASPNVEHIPTGILRKPLLVFRVVAVENADHGDQTSIRLNRTHIGADW